MNAGSAVMPQQRRPNHNNLNDHLEAIEIDRYSGTTFSRPTVSRQDSVAKIS